jgi:subtilisin family serine protease
MTVRTRFGRRTPTAGRLLVVALLLATASPSTPAAAARVPADGQRAGGRVETLPVVVRLRSRFDVAAARGGPRAERLERIVRGLREHANADQAPVRALISGEVARGRASRVTPLWIVNGIALDATHEAIRAIAAHPRVERVTPDRALIAPAAQAGLSLTRVPETWAAGAAGQGVVVASLDTGVDYLHPDLAARWRGGANSWYDPWGQHPTSPFDATGHGTATMGVIAGANGIGGAPAARWIAAKVFDDAGATTASRIHQAFQWVLDPDRNPATADAPDVVNNSWAFATPGCDLEFEADIAALRAAGILPVFAAGNSGPAAGSSRSPANNPGALAVGAIDADSTPAPFSARGPSACVGDEAFPDLTAPGVGVYSADLFDQYSTSDGTSMAAAHASGALAALLSVRPNAGPADQSAALLSGAYDLGTPGTDDDTGTGRLDAFAGYERIVAAVPAPSPSTAPPELFVSRAAAGPTTIGDVTGVSGEDVLSYGPDGFDMLFDGSDVGLAGVNVEAFARLDADSFLLSLGAGVTLPGTGLIERFDIVRFDATSLGSQTAGSYSWYLDGSDVGLAASGEQIDAVDVLPSGRVLVSTVGVVSVSGASGGGEDLLALAPTSLGATTAGTWTMYFDGSDVALTASGEKVDAAAVAPSGDVELSTTGAFAVLGLAGTADDAIACAAVSTGPVTACNWWVSPVFDGAPWGLSTANLDAIEVP